MDKTFQQKIDQRLRSVDGTLKDIEDDQEWDYHELLSFRTIWADTCGMIERLIEDDPNMTGDQKDRFSVLRERGSSISGKLEILKLENPLELRRG